jgi:hypothetical protein
MAGWEYQRVSSSIAERGAAQHDQAAQKIHDDWIELLNARGAEGWELVSERHTASKDPTGNLFFANYSGTMKRPCQ